MRKGSWRIKKGSSMASSLPKKLTGNFLAFLHTLEDKAKLKFWSVTKLFRMEIDENRRPAWLLGVNKECKANQSNLNKPLQVTRFYDDYVHTKLKRRQKTEATTTINSQTQRKNKKTLTAIKNNAKEIIWRMDVQKWIEIEMSIKRVFKGKRNREYSSAYQ